jgi:hypothetical protein
MPSALARTSSGSFMAERYGAKTSCSTGRLAKLLVEVQFQIPGRKKSDSMVIHLVQLVP